MRTFLLVLHIIGVAIWLGANGVQAFTGPRVASASDEVRAWWSDNVGAMARVLYNVAGILVLVSGVLLVIETGYEFSDAFVSIGFLAVIIGAVLGMAVFGPGSRKLTEAIHRNDAMAERSLTSRIQAFGILDTLVLLVTIVAMVSKWGY